MQSSTAYVADKVFPTVAVVHQSDKYFRWFKGDYYRDEAKVRADGTEAARVGARLDTASYSCLTYALAQDIGAQARRNQDPAVDLDTATTQRLMQQMLISKERKWASTYFTTGVWGTDITGAATSDSTHAAYWDDDANGDPFSDVATGQTAILQNTGQKPNKLTLGWPVFQALRKHPLVIDRIKYTTPAVGAITPQLLAKAFDVDEVLVCEAVYNSSREAAADTATTPTTMSFVQGKNALLSYAPPAAGLRVPAAGYTFAWQGDLGLANAGITIYQIPMPWLGRETVRTEAEMAYDMEVVGADLGYFFSGITQ
jgi:hypothetical protein